MLVMPNLTPNLHKTIIPSMRNIVDLAHLDNSRWIVILVHRDKSFSAHYKDQLSVMEPGKVSANAFSTHASKTYLREAECFNGAVTVFSSPEARISLTIRGNEVRLASM